MSWLDGMIVMTRARLAALAGDHAEAQRLFMSLGIPYSTRPPVYDAAKPVVVPPEPEWSPYAQRSA